MGPCSSLCVREDLSASHVALRHFTYEEIELHTLGARAHAALPEHGSNAIHAMLGWTLGALERTNEAQWPEPVAINPRTIRGGDTMFAIAERCTAELDVHLPPGMRVDGLRERVARRPLLARPGLRRVRRGRVAPVLLPP